MRAWSGAAEPSSSSAPPAFVPPADPEEERRLAEALRIEGAGHFREGALYEALDCFSRSLLLAESHVSYGSRSLVYNRLGQHSHALDDARSALRVEVTGKGYYRLASALMALGRYAEAVEECDAGVAMVQPGAAELEALRALRTRAAEAAPAGSVPPPPPSFSAVAARPAPPPAAKPAKPAAKPAKPAAAPTAALGKLLLDGKRATGGPVAAYADALCAFLRKIEHGHALLARCGIDWVPRPTDLPAALKLTNVVFAHPHLFVHFNPNGDISRSRLALVTASMVEFLAATGSYLRNSGAQEPTAHPGWHPLRSILKHVPSPVPKGAHSDLDEYEVARGLLLMRPKEFGLSKAHSNALVSLAGHGSPPDQPPPAAPKASPPPRADESPVERATRLYLDSVEAYLRTNFGTKPALLAKLGAQVLAPTLPAGARLPALKQMLLAHPKRFRLGMGSSQGGDMVSLYKGGAAKQPHAAAAGSSVLKQPLPADVHDGWGSEPANGWDAQPVQIPYSYPDADPYAYADVDADPYAYAEQAQDAYAHRDAYGDAYGDAYEDTYAQPAQAAASPAPRGNDFLGVARRPNGPSPAAAPPPPPPAFWPSAASPPASPQPRVLCFAGAQLLGTAEALRDALAADALLAGIAPHAGHRATVALACEVAANSDDGLALLSVATPSGAYVVDVAQIGADAVCCALWPLLSSTAVTKLIHGCEPAALALVEAGVFLAGVLDTRLVSGTVFGDPSASLDEMLQSFPGLEHFARQGEVSPPGGEGWASVRPLTTEAVAAAAGAVSRLLAVAPGMASLLADRWDGYVAASEACASAAVNGSA
ncbi:hypothetical protein T492DRAFT_1139900 [Pavlovales sp. CCMP2436]|nr:hypothetical protein T492DRAFT_1139900 [Pavlovales sp. CCMP2436]